MPILALTMALALSFAMNVSWQADDCRYLLVLAGPPLIAGLVLERTGKMPVVATIFSILGLTVSLTLVGIALALLGTRSPAPVADGWLAALDGAFPCSAVEIVRATRHWPGWSIAALHFVYEQTGLFLLITLVTTCLGDRCAVAWRMFVIWGASFVAVSLIAFLTPALGCFVHLTEGEVAHLPAGAGRYFMEAFNDSRNAADPVLSISKAGAVISFPSFHTVCALVLCQSWHGCRVLGPLTKFLTGTIILACVPMGGHYLIDLVGGAAVWWGATIAVDRLAMTRAVEKLPAQGHVATA